MLRCANTNAYSERRLLIPRWGGSQLLEQQWKERMTKPPFVQPEHFA